MVMLISRQKKKDVTCLFSYGILIGMVKCPIELPKLSEKSPDTLSQFEEFDNSMSLEMEAGYRCRK